MNKPIHYTKPSITKLEVQYATDAAQNGWGDQCYAYINKFEELFRCFMGTKYAIATSSCTGALHMGLSALGVTQGDEVILADTNWIATAAPITYLGAKPVFVDILSDSWCIDPNLVEKKITPKTKAIIATHIYGNLCDMDRLLEIGKKYNIPIIEDAAEAMGSQWHGKYAGSIGTFGTFSFHGTKTMTTGEGGMFVTNDAELYETMLTLSNHGRSHTQTKQFWPDMIGFKYKMSNIEAAIGCAQIERIDELIAKKRSIFKAYESALADLPLTMNLEPNNTVNGYWMPTVILDEGIAIGQKELQAAFIKDNIDARVFFHPLSSLDFFESRPENKIAYNIAKRALNLPSYHELSDKDLNKVQNIILKTLT